MLDRRKDGKPHRLRSLQQHAVVQRMQEPPVAKPAFFLDKDAAHHLDLPVRV